MWATVASFASAAKELDCTVIATELMVDKFLSVVPVLARLWARAKTRAVVGTLYWTITLTHCPFLTDARSAEILLGTAADAKLAPRIIPAKPICRKAEVTLAKHCINSFSSRNNPARLSNCNRITSD